MLDRRCRLLVLLIGTFLLASSGFAQEAPAVTPEASVDTASVPVARLQMGVDQSTIAVGEAVVVLLHASWPNTWQLDAAPDFASDFADVWLREVGPEKRWQEGELQHQSWQLTLLAERSGVWELPQPQLFVRDAAGQQQLLRANAVQVAVDLGDPPLIPDGPDWWRSSAQDLNDGMSWWWSLLAIPLLTLLGLWLLLRRRQDLQALSPGERFVQESALCERAASGKLAAQILSAALRRYLGDRLGFDGLGSTTADCARHLQHFAAGANDHTLAAARQMLLGQEARQTVLRILRDLDALRWGPREPSLADILPYLQQAQDWVRGHEERVAAALRAAQQAKAAGGPS